MKSFDKKIITIVVLLVLFLGGLWFIEKSHQLPDFSSDTIFYIGTQKDEIGRLMAFDASPETRYFLSQKNEVINQFLLYKSKKLKAIFYLSIPNNEFSDALSVEQSQTLYKVELSTGKKRKIPQPKNLDFSKMYPKIVNDKIFFESNQGLRYYSLRQENWGTLYKGIPLQDIALSESAQLLVGANPLKNFGFTLFPLTENESQSNPIGNYFQNFGFSPDGTQVLLKQKPDQDIFSDQSYLVIFKADGSAQEILKDKGDISQAIWMDNTHILGVLRDKNLIEKTISLDIANPENPITILENGSIQSMNFNHDRLLIVTKDEIGELDYDKNEGVQGLLDSFAQMKTEYNIWLYDMEINDLVSLPIQGFFPRTF